jgi:hypothetical protein
MPSGFIVHVLHVFPFYPMCSVMSLVTRNRHLFIPINDELSNKDKCFSTLFTSSIKAFENTVGKH